MIRTLWGALALLLVLALSIPPAFADAATTVDFSGIANGIINTLFPLLLAAAIALCHFVARKLKMDEHSAAVMLVDGVLSKAVGYGVTKAHGLISGGAAKIDVHSAIAASAVGYAQQYAPDLMKRFGLDPSDIANLALARLATMFPDLALPTTAPVLAPDAVSLDSGAATLTPKT